MVGPRPRYRVPTARLPQGTSLKGEGLEVIVFIRLAIDLFLSPVPASPSLVL
jgi:hypothetical protein